MSGDARLLWNESFGYTDRSNYRMQGIVGRVTLPLLDNSGPVQQPQTVGYPGEVRDGPTHQRYTQFGDSSVTLAGAKGVVLYQAGHRGWGTIIATEDERYRPTDLVEGESGKYMVDGADAQGNGGTTRWVLQGLLGWISNLFGVTINIGTNSQNTTIVVGNGMDTMTVNVATMTVTATGPITLKGPSSTIVVN